MNIHRLRKFLFAGECINSVAAGMTVKFFPVFFSQKSNVDPATFQIVFAGLSLLTLVGVIIARWLAIKVGRFQVILPAYILGIASTIALGLVEKLWNHPVLTLTLFVVRCTSVWSVSALLGSIMADYTPKAERARWKALSSVTAAGWSGSAMIGGWLIDRYGFAVTFVITGALQATMIPLWLVLVPLVAKESEILDAAAQGNEHSNSFGSAGSFGSHPEHPNSFGCGS